MKLLFDWIKEDWSIVKGEEKIILCNYAFIGQVLATGYTGLIFFLLNKLN